MSLLKKISNKAQHQSMEKLYTEFCEDNKIKLKLSGKDLIFEDGKWKQENGHHTDISSLIKENRELTEENNFLKLKIEILLLMLAETTAKTSL